MKKFFYSVLAAATMMLAVTSCSQEEEIVNGGSESGKTQKVTFKVEMPGEATSRAIADGVEVAQANMANKLAWALYESSKVNQDPVLTGNASKDPSSKEFNVSIDMVKGLEYKVLFLAYCDGGTIFDVTPGDDLKSLKYNPSLVSNKEAYDAFVACHTHTVNNDAVTEVPLTRPFAQINAATTDADLERAGRLLATVTHSSLTIANVPTQYNVLTGEASAYQDVTYGFGAILKDYAAQTNEILTVDNAEYNYLNMVYVLADASSSTHSATFTFYRNDNETDAIRTIDIVNLPIQRNHRTNVIGDLITQTEAFKIVIDEKFETPDNIVTGPWNGQDVKEPGKTDTEYLISSPAEWIWLKANKKPGMNIKLTANLDFGGKEVKGLGFTGEFDGQGYTMSNMTLLCGGSYYSNGLFQGDVSGEVTVKNVILENVTAECNNPNQGYVGAVFGDIQNNVTLENVHVKDADLCGVQSVGGLVGFVASGKTLTLKNCSVSDSYIHNYPVADESGFVAGLAGRPVGTVNATDCKVENSTIEGYYASRRGEASIAPAIGGQDASSGVTVSSDVIVKKTLMDNVVFVTPENLASTKFNETDKLYLFKGAFTGELTIKAEAENQIFDGREATFDNHIKFTAKRIAGNANELMTAKSGNYTFKGFKTNNSIAFGSCAVEALNIEDCEAYMMYFNISNSVVTATGNKIVRPASAEDAYKRYDSGTQQDLIQVYADNYTLNLYNNIIMDEKGVGNNMEVYGQHNWQTGATWTNTINATGNTISNVATTQELVKIYNDVTYAPVAWPADYEVTDAAKTLANQLNNENTLNGGSCVVSVLCRATGKADTNIDVLNFQ